MSSSVNVCTAERFERRAEGNAVGFDLVVIVVADVSMQNFSCSMSDIKLTLVH